MITEIEQVTMDFDWYFTDNEYIGTVASFRGKLPESVSRSSADLEILDDFFKSLTITSKVIINPKLNKILGHKVHETYLTHFVRMAETGLFSYDKTEVNSPFNSNYHLVAKPINPLKFSQLPIEIKDILTQTQYKGDWDQGIDVSSIC